MQTKHREQLSTQESVENSHSYDSTLVDRNKIDGTPFTIISFLREGETEKKHFLTFGKYRISPDKNTKEELEDYIEQNKWNIITNLIILISETLEMQKIEEYSKTMEGLAKQVEEDYHTQNAPTTPNN